jgi:adenosylmethionine-8-amino-7-oxononanoate aminotransferase
MKSLTQIDFDHMWHPFTQAKVWEASLPLIVDSAEGLYLQDVEGKRYLDGVSSLWCNVHGHGVPEIVEAVKRQVDQVCHSTLLGLTHRPIIELAEKLNQHTPDNLTRFFFADSGSTAVEAALRMAIEWWPKSGERRDRAKNRLASLQDAYHGDTLGAVGVGYLEPFHEALGKSICPAFRTPSPHLLRFYDGLSEGDALRESIERLKGLFSNHADELAAFIVEPLVQGAAGIWVHPPEYLKALADQCREHDVLLIVDEVATGFGKTGRMFSFEHAEIEPDLVVLGKGLSGGYFPISVVCATERIYQGFRGDPSELKTFFYGQTFAGNPVGAVASIASLELFEKNDVLAHVQDNTSVLHEALDREIAPLRHVDEIRRFGLMVGIELTAKPGEHAAYPANELAGHRVVLEARKRGLIIRPLGNVVILMPALAMTEPDLSKLVSLTAESIVSALGN